MVPVIKGADDLFAGRTPYVLWLADSASRPLPDEPTSRLPPLDSIFGLAGLDTQTLTDWHQRYGYDSVGQGDDGSLLLPDFPILGKLIDIIVDEVVLTTQESNQLAIECAGLEKLAVGPVAPKILSVLRSMAARANSRQVKLRIG